MADKEQQKPTTEEESGIEIHSIATDMERLGIDTPDANESKTQQAESEKKQETTQEKVKTQEKVDVPKKSRAQKRIERQQRDFNSLKNENTHLKEELESLKAKPEEKPTDGEISLDDYDSYDDYLEALEKGGEETKRPVVKETTPEPRIKPTALQDVFEDGNADYKDFDAKVRSNDLVLSEEVLAQAMDTDVPSEVLYYLGSNPEESKRISGLSKRKIIIELSKIGKDNTDTPKVHSKTSAPKPITPVSGSSIKGLSINDDNLSFEQHEALLNAQQNTTRGGFI